MKQTHVEMATSNSMMQLENSWMNLGEIWYGPDAIGDYPKIAIFNFRQ
jgi:hypothetical protein